ncbi:MAG: endonuclease III [Muribaculaceae bacterium]|nr:endonuclease III [Muribaculaceae bacterium]
MKIADRYSTVIERFSREMPDAATELHYTDTFQLLVAVILSAQCTDKRINMVTPALFAAFPDAAAMAKAEFDDIHPYITSVTYHNAKTRALMGMSRKLVDEFGGEVPSDIDTLTSLPGVGRKTANVLLSVAFDREAMPVDTHVFRVSERIGLTTNSKNPLQTERTLVKNIPGELLGKAHHWLILHGRYVCKARKPECEACIISDVCRYNTKAKRTKQ